jgi:hypothetical protein
MDHISQPQPAGANGTLVSGRRAKGYSIDDLATATGLPTEEITAAEDGGGAANQVGRIESNLR